jgi:pimeloyl-ACP methyl ester carboxylesterase
MLPFPLHLLLDWRIDAIVDRAGQEASFDPNAASPLRAITETDTPILLMHGTSDRYISPSNSQRLHDAAPGHSKLVWIEGKGHNSIMEGDSTTRVVREAVDWFDQHLTANGKPFRPPPTAGT